jgi:2-isopropylmalate synthase
VPARLVGRSQQIEIGPMSGKSNVVFWLEQRGIPADEDLVDRIFRRAKTSRTVLTEDEVLREAGRTRTAEEVQR